MRVRAAVLREMGRPTLYAGSRPRPMPMALSRIPHRLRTPSADRPRSLR